MSLIDMQWRPGDRQLRQFGLIALFALPLAGWLFSGKPWPADMTPRQVTVLEILAGLGVVAAGVALVRPQLLRWPFVIATLVALPIGLVVGEVVLLLIYFVVFLPVSLVFRLMGRDAMERGINRGAATYWQPKAPPAGPESYFRQS